MRYKCLPRQAYSRNNPPKVGDIAILNNHNQFYYVIVITDIKPNAFASFVENFFEYEIIECDSKMSIGKREVKSDFILYDSFSKVIFNNYNSIWQKINDGI